MIFFGSVALLIREPYVDHGVVYDITRDGLLETITWTFRGRYHKVSI